MGRIYNAKFSKKPINIPTLNFPKESDLLHHKVNQTIKRIMND